MVKFIEYILQSSEGRKAALPIEDQVIPNRFEYAVENDEPNGQLSILSSLKPSNNVPENIWSALYALRKANRQLMMARNAKRSVINELDNIAMSLKNDNSKSSYKTSSEPSNEIQTFSEENAINNRMLSHQNRNFFTDETSESSKNTRDMSRKEKSLFHMDNSDDFTTSNEYSQMINENRLLKEDKKDKVSDQMVETKRRSASDSKGGAVEEYPSSEWTINSPSENTESREANSNNSDDITVTTETLLTQEAIDTSSETDSGTTEIEPTAELTNPISESNSETKFTTEEENIVKSIETNDHMTEIMNENMKLKEDIINNDSNLETTEHNIISFSQNNNFTTNENDNTKTEINNDTSDQIIETEDASGSFSETNENTLETKSEESILDQNTENPEYSVVDNSLSSLYNEDNNGGNKSTDKDLSSSMTDTATTDKTIRRNDETQDDHNDNIQEQNITKEETVENSGKIDQPEKDNEVNGSDERNNADILEPVTAEGQTNQEESLVVESIGSDYGTNENTTQSSETNHSTENSLKTSTAVFEDSSSNEVPGIDSNNKNLSKDITNFAEGMISTNEEKDTTLTANNEEQDTTDVTNNNEPETSDTFNNNEPIITDATNYNEEQDTIDVTNNNESETSETFFNNDPGITDAIINNEEQINTDITNNNESVTNSDTSNSNELIITDITNNSEEQDTTESTNINESGISDITSSNDPVITDNIKQEEDTTHLPNSDQLVICDNIDETVTNTNEEVSLSNAEEESSSGELFKNKAPLNSIYIPNPVPEEEEDDSFYVRHATPVDSIFVGDDSLNKPDDWKYVDPEVNEYGARRNDIRE